MASRLSIWLWGLPVAIVLGCAVALWADSEMGLGSLFTLSREVGDARARVEDVRSEREALIHEIQLLRDDVFTIESHARRELGMVRPGETVLRWSVNEP